MKMLIYGLVTGIAFGFILQKGRVLRYDKQIGALLFRDMTIIKFMLTSVLVGMVGVYLLVDLGLAQLSIKATVLGGNILGGLIFGLGWGLLGYCPGTSAGALGEGRWDAVWGLFGMIAGAALYAEAFPLMQRTVLTWGNFGKISLPQVLGINHWPVIIVFIVGGLLLFRFIEKKGL
ncbi:YeeE/YedE thiosulfate transporter family protein [Desulfuromonas acetexigens]|uniref:YeeE/YedE family protein n=1 Tax=Trichloromonas acetexigens TaxID=38815 RepID=A0A550J644_9BACT|nr:YeeE/YedE thiosulfate transporter family protein [Desulfuromonas acetexigens]TRO78701.1 YeeE/YedE family protein [Desulfuromonas acetexigens]